MTLRGGCYCRSVRYEIDAGPTQQTACHCTICRHASGAPFVAWLTVPAEAFRFVSSEPARFKSSEHAARTFCGACGTPLTFQSTNLPGDLDVTTGSLDDPEQVPPKDHTFVRSKLSWVKLADGLPTYLAAAPLQIEGGGRRENQKPTAAPSRRLSEAPR